ncbi:Ig-like domain-containing protein [Bifidobacterium simiarum]|uniref:Beta-galactosidase n=1 Tax=Bifidobacterium simiarum TaxID=2045441 RepID=A0A2M9HE52_9BIFI|nr:Ig-like domain-containing protein [Bifidobacterium simiarum]PJM75104.1 hypothetical protein CSQ87_05740 [Bifidobacterium simiarum]
MMTRQNKEAQIPRESDFNEGWRFLRGASSGAQAEAFDDSAWREVRLPHDFGVEGSFSRLARSTVGFLRTGEGWYRKTFDAPEAWRGRRVSLSFDGVMELAEIWLNGEKLAEHHNGYAPFFVDLTDHLRYGRPNVLAVHTNTPEPCSRWYPGAGLYRDVRLVITDAVHVAHWGVRITTPTLEHDVALGVAKVQVETWLANAAATDSATADAAVTLRSEVLDASGASISSSDSQLVVPAGTDADPTAPEAELPAPVRQLVMVSEPHLWSTTDPYRYTLRTSVIVGGETVDCVDTPFGLRWIGMSSETGLSLNGVRMKIAGMCMHHDLGALGAAVYRRAVVRQLEILKEAGVNAIRTAHNIGSKVQIEEASRMGLLVLEELADMWTAPKDRNDYSNYFLADSATDLKAMIGRDRNEPSVFMWSLGNEVAWQESELPLAERLVAVAHEADPSRPVCINDSSYLSKGIDGIGNEIHQRMDVRGYSYASEDHLVAVHAKHPNDLIINSESGCSLGSRGYYVYPTDVPDGVRGTEFPFEPGRQPWDDDTYEITSYDITANRGTPIKKDFMRSMKLDFHMGEFTWTGFDYIGEPAPYIGNFYWNDPSQTESDGTVLAPKTAYYGIVDSAGFPKDEWWLYRSLWTDPDEAPMVHLLPHWNWRDGELVQVWAYSNAAKVELLLNGRSLGVREFEPHATGFHLDTDHADKPFEYRFAKDDPRDSLYLNWDVHFEPGTLEAVAYNDADEIVARDVVRTAGSPAGIRLTPDRGVIAGDGKDLSFITADIVDTAGVICPDADDRITFTVDHGVILGTDNGYQASTEAFQLPVRKAYRGKALAIVASDGSGQPIHVTTKAAGLADGDVTVTIATADTSTADTPVHATTAVAADVDPAGSASPTAKGFRPIAVIPHTTAVAKGTVPSLPDNVTVVYGDGGKRSEPVVWQDTDADRYAEPGLVTVRGDIPALAGESDVDISATAVVRVLGDDERPSMSVLLDDLRVNGETLDGFAPDRTRYALTLPYDAGDPVIEATARDNAAVAVIPPVNGPSGKYRVEISSEDGTRGATVDIMITVPPAPIASIGMDGDRLELGEDTAVILPVTAVDVLGRVIDPDDLDLHVVVGNPAVLAADGRDSDGRPVMKGTLAGETTITIGASYAGESIASGPLPVTVTPSCTPKTVTGTAPVSVRCEVGHTPELPAVVRVTFDHGFDADVPVDWQADDTLWNTPGDHGITGTVAGLPIEATASVHVVAVIAVQRVSTATVTGIRPDLAETAPTVHVWWSDGAVEERDVDWAEPDPSDYAKAGTFTVTGTVAGVDGAAGVDGVVGVAEASVRVTDEYVRNRDLFSFRNDVYPTVEASYTNTDPKVMEDVSNLMDGTVSYTARAGYNLKNRWSTLGDPGDVAWLEYRFGYGTETAFMLNAFTIYYCLEGDGVALPADVRVLAWRNGEWTPVRDLTTSDHPVEQQGSAGWIYGSFGDKTRSTKIDRGLERTYRFAMVKTSRIRIEFTSEPGHCVAITEIRGDAQVAVVNETCELSSLTVNGRPVAVEPGVDAYDVDLAAASDTVAASGSAGGDDAGADVAGAVRIEARPADDHAAITVIPPIVGSGAASTAFVEVTAENGIARRTIALHLK